MNLIAKGISKEYLRDKKSKKTFFAVGVTDFELAEGKFTEIVGRSGSGKSTFLNILAGVLTPSSGKLFIDDKDVYALDDRERSILRNSAVGVIPQGQTALKNLTVLENVLLPLTMYGEKDDDGYALELLKKVGIDDLKDCYPAELSGGEMRRLAIARALIRKPGILLADEPTGDLDDENTINVLELLKSLTLDGVSVLMVTHDKEAEGYADEIYRMNVGQLIKEL